MGETLHELQARIARLEAALRELLQYANQHEAQTLGQVDDGMWQARKVLDGIPSENR